jgi:hypothetical protein
MESSSDGVIEVSLWVDREPEPGEFDRTSEVVAAADLAPSGDHPGLSGLAQPLVAVLSCGLAVEILCEHRPTGAIGLAISHDGELFLMGSFPMPAAIRLFPPGRTPYVVNIGPPGRRTNG